MKASPVFRKTGGIVAIQEKAAREGSCVVLPSPVSLTCLRTVIRDSELAIIKPS